MGENGTVFEFKSERLEARRAANEEAARKGLGERFPLFPRGHLTLIMGEPGTGKSLLGLEQAARVTVRSRLSPAVRQDARVASVDEYQSLPRERRPETAVVYWMEDDEETVTYRLAAARADLRLVKMMWGSSLVPEKPVDVWTKPASLIEKDLERIAREEKIGVVLLDPLPAFLGGKDVGHGATVRNCLMPLLDLAKRYQFALIGVTHVSKEGGKGLHRAIGSQAYTAMARSVLWVMKDDVTWDRDRRLVVPVKNNQAAIEGAYAFGIETLETGSGEELLRVPRVVWEAGRVVEHRMLGGMGEEEELREERAVKLQFAEEFLKEALKEGPKWSKALEKEARDAGISKGTLERARGKVGAKGWKEGTRWVVGRGRGMTG